MRIIGLSLVAGLASAMAIGAALAESPNGFASGADPVFGSRTDKPDGSVTMTIGRRLPTDWDAKVGTDVSLAGPTASSQSENFRRGPSSDRSTGSVWGNLTMPGLSPYDWDKTDVEARLGAAPDQTKLGATLKRSIPLGRDLSVTVQNSTSVTQPVSDAAPGLPLIANPLPASAGAPTWATDQSVRLNINPSGTALSAGEVRSSSDDQWHQKLSVEQTLFGPLKVTTSVEDAGKPASKKSISAGFKHVW